jgi:hypothetical protein
LAHKWPSLLVSREHAVNERILTRGGKMRWFKLVIPLFSFLFGAWGGPSEAVAQEAPAVIALEAAAATWANHGQWERSAALYAEAAAIRGFGDEGAIDNLHTAASLLYYVGNLTEALAFMTGAAGQAVASGYVLKAAEVYVDGAWIALEMQMTPTARVFAESAKLLARSPHLTEAESASILARLGEGEITLRVSER